MRFPPGLGFQLPFATIIAAMIIAVSSVQADDLRVAELSGPVPAPIEDVWSAFTTSEGLSSFYAQKAYVEPEIGGLFELYILPENPVGQRGLEGQRILAIEPERRLLITWAAPRFVEENLGSQSSTIQEITFAPEGPNTTIVRFRQFGFGETPEWAGTERYFQLRQYDVYINLLEKIHNGSVDWEKGMARFFDTSDRIKRGMEAN